jgi:hypothetical protein
LIYPQPQSPYALKHAIQQYGFIDEWASKVHFDATIPTMDSINGPTKILKKANQIATNQPLNKARRTVNIKLFTRQGDDTPLFWFMAIDNAFSESFWEQWNSSIDEMRFCVGLGGKNNAYVRSSAHDAGAVFTTASRFTYETLPMSKMEEKILSLAKFVMSFQRAYVERLYGADYVITWDANLLHHVIGPIANAVYSAHSDYSPLLCSLNNADYTHVDGDVYLPIRDHMQVLTIYCSNYQPNSEESCTRITYYHDKKKLVPLH